MNAVDTLFQRLLLQRRKAFIPFVPPGDPALATTKLLVRELARRGADLIEIGFPYSDPIADGSIIQAAYTRALSRGVRVDDVFAACRELGNDFQTPLIAMISYSLVYRRGVKRFIADAKAGGFSGAIVPDLPVDEAADLASLASDEDFSFIQLVTPTTPPERAKRIAQLSTGFLYCVSVTGITGIRTQLRPELLEQLRWLRTLTDLPLCVGFGISTPEQVRMLRDHVDGVIVGSAFVRRLESAPKIGNAQTLAEIGDLAEELKASLA